MEFRARKPAAAGVTTSADRIDQTDSVKNLDAVNGAREPASDTATSEIRLRPSQERAQFTDRKEQARFTDRSGIPGRGGRAGSDSKALLFMALLALQYGLQPILTRKLLSRDVLISSQVITCEVLKVLIAVTAMFLDSTLFTIWRHWHPLDSLQAAAVPGLLYAAQNTLVQVAYRHLDYLTFNLLNQTKLLFTALSNYLFLRIRQSRRQMLALCLLLLAATLLTLGPTQTGSAQAGSAQAGSVQASSNEAADGAGEEGAARAAGVAWERLVLGVVPVMVASVTSGLGSTHNQWQVQVKRRSPHLFTIEMCTLTSIVLLVSLLSSQDGARMAELGFFHAWTPLTVIPALSNAIGGILVGLVTKYAGGVKKGFTVIAGLLVTAIVQYVLDGTPPSLFVWLALPLTILSTYLYSSSSPPPRAAAASAPAGTTDDEDRKKQL